MKPVSGGVGCTIQAVIGQQVPAPLGAILGGRYQLVNPIGVGISSRVYLAADTQLRRRVAVKVLHESLAVDQTFLKQFREEARAAAALNHPNILAVFDWGEDTLSGAAVPYLVTEYLSGGSLRSILDSGQTLTPSQALIVGLETSRALHHAHDRGLVHRDVKPANLLFGPESRLRLADFGLARALAEASWTEPAGVSAGTTRYASPEQFTGARVDGKSDVYSAALVLMEAVDGLVPLLGPSSAETMAARIGSEVEVSLGYGRLRGPLMRATATDASERCNASEFEIALLAAAEGMPKPDPIPVVPILGVDDQTTELRLSDPLAGIAIVGSLAREGEEVNAAEAGIGARTVAPPAGRVTPQSPETALEGSGDADENGFGGNPPVESPAAAAVVTRSKSGTGTQASTRKRRWPKVLAIVGLILLVVGGAAGWWFFIRIPSHEVPDWIGHDVELATGEAKEFGWELADPVTVRQDGTVAGEITEQIPAPGVSWSEGEEVTFTVSLGPTLTTWPDVVAMTEAEATEALVSAGLVLGDVTSAHDEEVAQGTVVSATPAEGYPPPDDQGEIPRETPVNLVISRGPAPRAVPEDIVGVPIADAKSRLTEVQLTAGVSTEFSETIPTGVVIRSGISPGTEVRRDSVVPLAVSDGPQPIPIPDVIGKTGTQAASELETAGFVVSGIEGSPSGAVLATDPPAGEPHQRGTAVRIFTRQ